MNQFFLVCNSSIINMNKFIATTILCLIAFQASMTTAKVVPVQKSVFETLAEDARNVVKSFADATGISTLSSEKVIQTIEIDAKKVAANIDSFVEQVKKDVDANKPELDKVIKQVKTELIKTSESLKKLAGPEATKKVEEVTKALEKNLNEAIEQVNKVVKAVQPSAEKLRTDLEASGKVVLKSIVDGAKNIGKIVDETVKKVEKSLK
ncbi:uncharacterized protein LOC123684448 [Harmonia axyridis]|uniref:uncharacterized protein LOC123684448 n=1 Tax=Harmonia axyridis TaxID=115357 RepID=UPI001E279294|nr:uncharacterized protein LOC123684448 [Harmonia axyridis]